MTSVYRTIALWIPLIVVPRSSATVAIETFMTELRHQELAVAQRERHDAGRAPPRRDRPLTGPSAIESSRSTNRPMLVIDRGRARRAIRTEDRPLRREDVR
jgi:hypothetical protein